MNKQTVVVECRDLYKSFNEGGLNVDVLKGINLAVNTSERIAVMGASGSGKSTLLHLLGGLDYISRGNVMWNHSDISSLPERKLARLRNQTLGFIYQFHHLLGEFTVQENVAMPLMIRGETASSSRQQAKEILERVNLDHRLQHKPGELSGGERQRAAVARALVTRPKCVLADEPTGNLDSKTAELVFELMLQLNREYASSLVVVTHDVHLAQRMDKVYMMNDGVLETHES
ncbi:MAG: lipoprotein-releasing ABC transporter ATP-binding protein LolD [Gammaproteobacteria bacterium]|nr:lipoprotein-releasing ABC transporter ATP-binding protein LolD [Gammaproteobacteria bacterium]